MKKNIKKPINRYEVQKKTTTFVKERLPAYVLAILMVFWTIASILGIIAFAKNDTKKSAMSTVKASAEAVNISGYRSNFIVPLNGLTGLQFNNITVGDQMYLIFGEDVYGSYIYLANYESYVAYKNGDESLVVPLFWEGDSLSTAGDYWCVGLDDNDYEMLTLSYYSQDRFSINVRSYENAYFFYPSSMDYTYEFAASDDLIIGITLNIGYAGYGTVNYESFHFELEFYSSTPTSVISAYSPYFNEKFDGFGGGVLDFGVDFWVDELYADLASDFYFKELYRLDRDNLRVQFNALQDRYDELVANSGRENELLASKIKGLEYEIAGLENVISRRNDEISTLNERIDYFENTIDSLNNTINSLRQEVEQAYADGRNAGYANGYDIGYAQGATDSNRYTFDGLLSAVFDVPVRTFRSLFSFEILGINLANFFLSLLTLAIIIFVVRWIL